MPKRFFSISLNLKYRDEKFSARVSVKIALDHSSVVFESHFVKELLK